MTAKEATAEVFYTAFKALPREERDAVIVRLAREKSIREDLLDLATVERRRKEPSRPFREFLRERGQK